MSSLCHKKLFWILLDLYFLIFLRKGVVSIVTATLHGCNLWYLWDRPASQRNILLNMSCKNPVLVSKKNLIFSKLRHLFEVLRLWLICLDPLFLSLCHLLYVVLILLPNKMPDTSIIGFCLQLLTALPNINCLDSYFLLWVSALSRLLLECSKAAQVFLRISVWFFLG